MTHKRLFVFPDGLVTTEAWSERCLEEGVGPCSVLRHGDEAEWPEESAADRELQYEEEARERRKRLSQVVGGRRDPDAPPAGYRLRAEAWVPALPNKKRYDRVQVTLWRLRRRL